MIKQSHICSYIIGMHGCTFKSVTVCSMTYLICNDLFNLWHIRNPGILRTLVYSGTWHIQNPRPLQNPVKCLRWSVLGKQLTCIIFANYIYFCNTRFSRFLLCEINVVIFLITCLILIPQVFILCKKEWRLRRPQRP